MRFLDRGKERPPLEPALAPERSDRAASAYFVTLSQR